MNLVLLDSQAQLWDFATLFARISALFSFIPGFGEASVSVRVKLFLSAAVSVVLFPTLDFSQSVTLSLLFQEVLIGLILGLTMRLFTICLQTCGSIAAQCTSLSQILGLASAEPMPSISHILMFSGICLLFVLDWHFVVLESIYLSFAIFPIGAMPSAEFIYSNYSALCSSIFSLAFALSMPFIVASFLYNLTLGVINKAMPQLMVAFVGAPVITGGSLVVLLLSIVVILSSWEQLFFEYVYTLGPLSL